MEFLWSCVVLVVLEQNFLLIIINRGTITSKDNYIPMLLGNLMGMNGQMDAVLANPELLDRMLDSGGIQDLIGILAEQVENRLAEAVLSLDNYVIVNGEEISIFEANLKTVYLQSLIDRATKEGEIEVLNPLIEYMSQLQEAVSVAIYKIDVPLLEEEEEDEEEDDEEVMAN